MRTPVYEKVLAELEAEGRELARKLYFTLQDHPEGVTRAQLVYLLFGRAAKANLGNDTADRKIRATIAAMRSRLIPIVSTSGDAGYKLDDSPEARHAMLSEMVSRRDRMNEQIEAASKSWQIPVQYREPETATQARLI
jgi:hypothetical protein